MKSELADHARALFPIVGSGRERVEFLGLAFVPRAESFEREEVTYRRVNLQLELRLTRADGSVEEGSIGLPVPEMAGIVGPDGRKHRIVLLDGIRFVVTSDAFEAWLERCVTATAERGKFRYARWAPDERSTIATLLEEKYRGI